MTFAVYTKGLRKSWYIGVIPAIFVGLVIIMVASIWPEFEQQIDVFARLLESELYQAILGETGASDWTTFQGFYSSYLFIWLEYIMIFMTIFAPVRIIGAEVDKNTLDIMLSYPISRWRFLTEKFLVYNTYTFAFPIIMLISTYIGATSIGETMDYVALFLALFGVWLLFFGFGALTLLVSTIFLETGRSYPVAGLVVIGMWMLERLGGLVDSLKLIRNFSLFHYLNGSFVINNYTKDGNFPLDHLFIVVSVGVIAFLFALYIFENRELAY